MEALVLKWCPIEGQYMAVFESEADVQKALASGVYEMTWDGVVIEVKDDADRDLYQTKVMTAIKKVVKKATKKKATAKKAED